MSSCGTPGSVIALHPRSKRRHGSRGIGQGPVGLSWPGGRASWRGHPVAAEQAPQTIMNCWRMVAGPWAVTVTVSSAVYKPCTTFSYKPCSAHAAVAGPAIGVQGAGIARHRTLSSVRSRAITDCSRDVASEVLVCVSGRNASPRSDSQRDIRGHHERSLHRDRKLTTWSHQRLRETCGRAIGAVRRQTPRFFSAKASCLRSLLILGAIAAGSSYRRG